MTHQEIASALDLIYARAREVAAVERKWIEGERARLVKECGAIGHIWGGAPMSLGDGRCCLICHTHPPRPGR